MVMPIIKMQVDGQYLETLVSGYRTLTVEGREELDLNVINAEIDTSDGGRYLRRKIKSRVLNVRFAVEDSTPGGFAVKFKALKAELYKIKESQIIFTALSLVMSRLTVSTPGSSFTSVKIQWSLDPEDTFLSSVPS